MPETNLNVANDFGEITAIDFVNRFSNSIYDLLRYLGVTRQEEMGRDQKIRTYKWDTDLNPENVGEGDLIPLSKVTRALDKEHQVEWFKKRRSVSAEAVARHGREVAITQADNRIMNALQYEFETQFVDFLKASPTKANGGSLQEAIANAWGKLSEFNEFRGAQLVYFVNPIDVAEYLGSAPVGPDATNIFGMRLMQNFLGVDNVVMLNTVPKGNVYATAVDNLVFAYLNVRTSDVAGEFADFSDELGFIGASRDRQISRLSLDSVFFGANVLFAEIPKGVVNAKIEAPSEEAPSEPAA